MKETIFDTSGELLIQRSGNGVKLVRPDKLFTHDYQNNHQYPIVSLTDMSKFPFHLFFYDNDHRFQYINEMCASDDGFISTKDAIGKTVHETSIKESANRIINNNMLVLKTNTMKIIEETLDRNDGIHLGGFSIKFPLYGDNNVITGIFGLYTHIDPQNLSSLANSLELITRTGLLANPQGGNTIEKMFSGRELKGIYLSSRELECLRLLFTGKTAKMIAKALQLSPRTVEHYLENIKAKYEVSSKADLIEKIISK